MKEIKIKEKHIYEAMNRVMEKKDGIRLAMEVLAESLSGVNKTAVDLWCEIEKLYKLDPKKRYYYIKKTHAVQETCTKNAEPSLGRTR